MSDSASIPLPNGDSLQLRPWAKDGISGLNWPHRHWPGEGPLLVCLHGFTGSHLDWEATAQHLPKANLLAIDLPGHSAAADSATDLPSVLEVFERVQEAAHSHLDCLPVWIGYSLGGRLLRQYLTRTQAMTAAIVVGAGIGIADTQTRKARRQADERWIRELEAGDAQSFLRAWQSQPVLARAPAVTNLWIRRRDERRLLSSLSGWASALRDLGQGVLPVTPESLPVPSLLVAGAEDQTYKERLNRLSQADSRAHFVAIPQAGHAPILEQPEGFADSIGSFLAGL